MAIDLRFERITATVSSADAETLLSPAVLARLKAALKAELARDAEEDRRREADRRASRAPGRRR